MVITDFRKKSKKFGDFFTYLPLEVKYSAWRPIKMRIEKEKGI